MKIEKLTDLKKYASRRLMSHLISIRNDLQDDFLTTDPIQTKKTITDKINKILSCSTKKMKSEDIDTDTGELVNFVLYDNGCNQYVLCPMCARKRSEEIWSNYSERIEAIAEKYKDKHIYMMTYTLEDQDSFQEMYTSFQQSLVRFMKMGQKREGLSSVGEYSKIKAAIMGIEVTLGKNSKKIHVHGHMLAFCDEPLDYEVYTNQTLKNQLYDKYGYGSVPEDELLKAAETFVTYKGEQKPVSKLTNEWFKATKGHGVGLDVRPIKKEIPIKKQCLEIIKYAVKTADITKEFALDVLCYKEGKRFFRSYGEFINRNGKKIEESENMETPEDRPLVLNEIMTQIYDIEKEEYTPGTEEDEHIAHELYKRKKEIVEFMGKCTMARNHKKQLLQPVQMMFTLSMEEYSREKKLETIKTIDSIFMGYKYYLKYLYDKILKMPHIKTYIKKLKTMSPLEKYYYNSFLSLKLVPDESTK